MVCLELQWPHRPHQQQKKTGQFQPTWKPFRDARKRNEERELEANLKHLTRYHNRKETKKYETKSTNNLQVRCHLLTTCVLRVSPCGLPLLQRLTSSSFPLVWTLPLVRLAGKTRSRFVTISPSVFRAFPAYVCVCLCLLFVFVMCAPSVIPVIPNHSLTKLYWNIFTWLFFLIPLFFSCSRLLISREWASFNRCIFFLLLILLRLCCVLCVMIRDSSFTVCFFFVLYMWAKFLPLDPVRFSSNRDGVCRSSYLTTLSVCI